MTSAVTLFGIPNCDTIKKTRRWLEQQGIDYNFHDYKKMGLDSDLAAQLLERFGSERVINTRGTTWRKLDESQRDLSNSKELIKLMQEQPSVVKRPILSKGDLWLLGYDENELAHLTTP